jgi:hypothetical protein
MLQAFRLIHLILSQLKQLILTMLGRDSVNKYEINNRSCAALLVSLILSQTFKGEDTAPYYKKIKGD